MNVNTVTIIGRLTRDPEMKAMPSGSNVTNFSLATSRKYKKDEKDVEETEFHNCVAYGKPAELIAQYMTKGALMLVQGRLKTQSWEKEGQKHYRTEIVVENFQFGPRAANSSSNGSGGSTGQKAQEEDAGYDPGDLNPEDIPF